ncbi:MAG: hypothetical protein PVI86_03635 [Phycisphaerae bacterium]
MAQSGEARPWFYGQVCLCAPDHTETCLTLPDADLALRGKRGLTPSNDPSTES